MLFSSQFQGFCRDLHSQCLDAFVVIPAGAGNAVTLRTALRAEFQTNRKLTTGNPNPGNIGSDFNRFGLQLFAAMKAADAANQGRQDLLERLNVWRNAIGHQDFNKPELAGRTTDDGNHSGSQGLARGVRRVGDGDGLGDERTSADNARRGALVRGREYGY